MKQLKEVANTNVYHESAWKRFTQSQNSVGYLFIAPNILVYVIFSLIPMLCAIIFSMMDFSITWSKVEWVWFEQYAKVFKEWRWWNALWNTAVYAVINVVGTMFLSVMMANLIKEKKAINVVFRSCYFLPVLCSMTVVALVWKFLLDAQIGALQYYLRMVGIRWGLLTDPNQALITVACVSIWKGFGYQMVIFLAALQGVPEVYYEAASIDGVGRFRKFWNITIPQIMPTVSFCLVTSIIGSFQVFDSIYIMTSGGPLYRTETVVTIIYEFAFARLKMGFACAMSICLFIIIAILSLLSLNRTGKATDE